MSENGKLIKMVRQPDGSVKKCPTISAWKTDEKGKKYFWGIDDTNRAALWEKGKAGQNSRLEYSGWIEAGIHQSITSR